MRMRRFRKWIVTLGILGVAPGMAVAGLPEIHLPAISATAKPVVESVDQAAAKRIREALEAGRFRGARIHVQFQNGTAVLLGTARDEVQKRQIEALLLAERDVKKVVNKLVVNQPGQTPQLLPIRAAHEISRGAAPSAVQQASHERQSLTKKSPQLLPKVPNLFKPHTTRRAKSRALPFRNLFKGRRDTASLNQKIAETIAAQLRNAKISGYDMEVTFKDGVATISGQIENAREKARVSRIVAQVPGVRSVRNELVVKSQNKIQQQPSFFDNQTIAQRAAAALKKAKIVGDQIDVEVRNGVARLSGRVADSLQKAKAAEVVASVPGIKMVDNQLQVSRTVASRAPQHRSAIKQTSAWKPETVAAHREPNMLTKARKSVAKPTNQEMAERIAAALRQAQLSGYDIEVNFKDGVATLKGKISTPQQKAAVEQCVRSVPGVKVVQNLLTVVPATPVVQQPVIPTGAVQPQQAMLAPVALPAAAVQQLVKQQQPSAPTPAPATGPVIPPAPPSYGHPGSGASNVVYNMPHLPEYAWPAYAAYPNYAQVTYPTQYSASAWPYIGPFYPYPQIPLGWRQVQLEWDDGYWNLNFRPRTNKWWWFLNPENWTK